jgi:hypothetical protein
MCCNIAVHMQACPCSLCNFVHLIHFCAVCHESNIIGRCPSYKRNGKQLLDNSPWLKINLSCSVQLHSLEVSKLLLIYFHIKTVQIHCIHIQDCIVCLHISEYVRICIHVFLPPLQFEPSNRFSFDLM